MWAFKDYMIAKSGASGFPVPESQFKTEFKAFSEDTSTSGGMQYALANQIGYIKGELKFIALKAISKGDMLAPYTD